MNVKSMLSVLAFALAMVGCGEDGGNGTDVLIIVPDSGRADTLDTDGFVGDQGVDGSSDRDVSTGDNTVDPDVSIPDHGGTDTNVGDTVEPTDEGQDMIEDVAPVFAGQGRVQQFKRGSEDLPDRECFRSYHSYDR